MTSSRTVLLTTLAMLAFAGNSLLCRAALKGTAIDAASFTVIRLVAGALVLGLVTRLFRNNSTSKGSWASALVLLVYAFPFSYAYVQLSAATGALLLFATVQITMIGYGLWTGERLRLWQLLGLVLAFAGLTGLLLPGLSAPPLLNALLMICAGITWGIYSLHGRRAGDPVVINAGNFLRAAPLAVVLGVPLLVTHTVSIDISGCGYAVTSGALTSGLGYVLWYHALPALKASTAAIVQLSVPVIAALVGAVWLGEALSLRLLLASFTILGGIALFVIERRGGHDV